MSDFEFLQSSAEVVREEKFKRSPITQTLIDVMRSCPPGETVTYGQLSEVVHLDLVQQKNRHYLQSARTIACDEHGVVFVAVRNVGLRRLANDEIAAHANTTHHKKLVEDTKRYGQKIDAVEYDALEASRRPDYWMARGYLSLRQGIASKPVQKAIKQQSSQDLQPKELVDTKATIDLLKNLWK